MKVFNKTLTGKTLKPAVPVNAAVCQQGRKLGFMRWLSGCWCNDAPVAVTVWMLRSFEETPGGCSLVHGVGTGQWPLQARLAL